MIDRRLLGARPLLRYGRWCMEMARAAEDPRAASFYLGELHGWLTDGRGADRLTVESVRASLAGDKALVKRV